MKHINSNSYYLYILSLIFLVSSCSSTGSVERVSIINLIVTPEEYKEKHIEVKGFLQYDGELLLYIDEVRAKNIDFSSAIYVEDKSVNNDIVEKCAGKYVSIRGISSYLKSKNIILKNISNIYSLGESHFCWSVPSVAGKPNNTKQQ